MENNIPKLRFPDYNGEWEEKKLGEIGDIVTGNTPSTANEEFYNGEYHFVSPFDINEQRFFEQTKTTLTKLGFSKGRKIRAGSSLFVCIGSTIGKVAQNKIDCITNQQINSIVPSDDFNDDFVFSLLENHSSKIKMLAAEQAVPIINKTTFSKYIVLIPTLPEQTKIASFLTAVDDKLSSLKKKKQLLEQYKKGVMQQIFSQQLRFKDDNGEDFEDWEDAVGGDIFDSISNKDHNSDLPILAISQEFGAVPREMINYQISVTDKSIESYKVVEIGDFIISLRSFQGGIEYSKYKGICSPAYIILRAKVDINNKFYKYYFKTDFYIQQLCSKLEGIRDGKMISYKYFSEIELPYPSLAEQTKIANFLSAIDEKISHCGVQIEKMEGWKKGLLQQMFV